VANITMDVQASSTRRCCASRAIDPRWPSFLGPNLHTAINPAMLPQAQFCVSAEGQARFGG